MVDMDTGDVINEEDPFADLTDLDEAEDYVEEITNPDGSHTRKEVHQGDGFKSVRITKDLGAGGIGGGGIISGGGPLGIEDLMGQMMADMMSGAMMGGAPGGGTIRISGGPMGGGMMVRQRISMGPPPILDDKDDDDLDGIPPEIMEMMRMTEAMAGGPSMFGGPRFRIRKSGGEIPADHALVPREEESHDEIMARMDKLSAEIGERHEKKKYQKVESQS